MISRIKALLKDEGHVLYTKPYQLNIVGLRSRSTVANRFDDEIHVFYCDAQGTWNYNAYKATTDPGTYWLRNPSYNDGTAILMGGQYKDCFSIGLHRGKYKALKQVKPVTIIRDYDRDAFLDFENGTKQTGIFGINIHRAESSGSTQYIDKYSAGCQVFQNATDFDEFMQLCETHRSLYGNAFTYTLLDFRAVNRLQWKRIIAASTVIATAALAITIKNVLFDEHA
ncbi:MAG TPA: hypothetical protein VIN08_20400 [Ohtaekwangia sp.]|uniref:hypothetical protein n=1 Tax=Ohtaekwangia sp. TaxID=2066019 RepID=UPI002F92FFE8